MGSRKEWILVIAIAAVVCVVKAQNETTTEKSGKVFSIFSVVTFKNEGCRSNSAMTTGQSPFRNGTCFQASECSTKGGIGSGNCASGFGVCCLFTVSATGTTVNQNCTYISNPGFPTALSTTTAISYTVNKVQNDICWLRLDFESFTIAGPSVTTEANGAPCTDKFSIVSSNNQVVPTICGVNTGQHIYVEMGSGATDNAQLQFTFDATQTGTSRNYEIKTSQIQCSNPNRPPAGCLQYWTTPVGRITTFNFAASTLGTQQHLPSQDYTACVRRNTGYCCVQYQVCEGVINAFSLDTQVAPGGAVISQGLYDTYCTADYIGIPASSTTCSFNNNFVSTKYCGNNLGYGGVAANQPICDCTAPFRVNVKTDGAADAAAATNPNRGVCLDFQQIPCTTN